MSRWTHQICGDCWNKHNLDRTEFEPHSIRFPREEKCCWCGELNRSGIYTRADPKSVLCKGSCEW